MRYRVLPCLVVVAAHLAATACFGAVPASPLMAAMQAELDRSMQALGDQPEPPYFLSYEITDIKSVQVEAAFGALTSSSEQESRILDIDLRVGSHELDSTHPIQSRGFADMLDRYAPAEIPIQDDPAAIRSVLWYETDRRYKRALERFMRVKTDVAVKVEAEDDSDDLTREQPHEFIGPLADMTVDRAVWEDKLRAYTAPFAVHGEIYDAKASLTASRQNRWFVNSEGSRIQDSRVAYRLVVSAQTKADDGMELPRFESFFAYDPKNLPSDAEILGTVRRMIDDLLALRVAPEVDPYTGPAILSGRASGVFFHEIFGHRVEGQRQRGADDAQTFKRMIDQRVLPETFSVTFDPAINRMAGTDLAGHYAYDNQGVRGQRVTVVENGMLRGFLMSRKPVEGFPQSNGHGRKQPGSEPVARQSNMIIEVSDPVSGDALKQQLIERIVAEGRPFGLRFEDIQGGFTFTGRMIPNAFNVIPVMVYKVYPDGREELVRGVDIIGTPLTAFSMITAGDDQLAVFNGNCGAESGWVPVSCVSPAILVSQIEVQKKQKSQQRPPLLPPPFEKPKTVQ